MRKANSFSHIGRSAVYILPRLAARNAVKEKLRGDGVRLSLVPIREIHEQAQQYLADHPELYEQALERAHRMGMIDQQPAPSKKAKHAFLTRRALFNQRPLY